LSGLRHPDTIRAVRRFRFAHPWTVILLRRLVVFIALLGCVIAPASAIAAPQDVLDDYNANNAIIAECHSAEDYAAARNLPNDGEVYGDLQGAIDEALTKPELVGTPEKPCPETDEESGSGVGTVALIAIPVAAALLVGAVLVARRRRDADSGKDA